MSDEKFPGWHGTTILAVRRGGKVVVAGDGQVSVGPTVMKGTARKVRRLKPGGHDVVVSWKLPRASWRGPASIWPRTGGWTSICAIWRPC